jgi:hypothetical protein
MDPEGEVDVLMANNVLGVAFPLTREPPSPDFVRSRRIRDVDDHVELIIAGVVRLEVRRSCGDVGVPPVERGHEMGADRVGSRGIEETHLLRLIRGRDIEQVEPGRCHTRCRHLFGQEKDVSSEGQRVATHRIVLAGELGDELGCRRVGDVQNRHRDGRVLVGHIEKPSPVAGDLHRHPLADVRGTVEGVVGDEAEVVLQSDAGQCNGRFSSGHSRSPFTNSVTASRMLT